MDSKSIKQKLMCKIDEKIVNQFDIVKQKLFEADDSHLKNLQNKIDAMRKDILDLNMRKRNSDNDEYKKNIDRTIEAKRKQVRTIQKSLQVGRLSGVQSSQG